MQQALRRAAEATNDMVPDIASNANAIDGCSHCTKELQQIPHASMMCNVTRNAAVSVTKAKSLLGRCAWASMEAVGGEPQPRGRPIDKESGSSNIREKSRLF